MDVIKKVLPEFKKPNVKGDKSGVCWKCFGKATKAEKMERNLQKLKQDLYKSWIQLKTKFPAPTDTVLSFKKSESGPSPKRVDAPPRGEAPSPPRGEERSVFLPWSQSTQKPSNDITESAPTGHVDSTSERTLNKPPFLRNIAMASCKTVNKPPFLQNIAMDSSRTVNKPPFLENIAMDSCRTVNKPPFLENIAMYSCRTVNKPPFLENIAMDSCITVNKPPFLENIAMDSCITVNKPPFLENIAMDSCITVNKPPFLKNIAMDSCITVNKPPFLENIAMDSCNVPVQQERPSNDSMELEEVKHHTDNTSLDICDTKLEATDSFSVKQEEHNYCSRELETKGKHNSSYNFLEHDSDENFMFNAPSPSAPSPPRMLPREYAPSPSSSSSSPVASPQSSDYTPSSPQLREQSVNVPWTRDSHVDNPMAIRSLRDVLPRKPMHEYERTSDGEEEGPRSFSVKPDPSDTDSAELDSNYEHRVIIDNAEIKSEPVDLRMEPVYQFGTNEVPPVRDCENTELETKDEHPSNNASHNIKIKLEPMDDFTAKEEPPDNGNTELENNVDDEHHTNNKTSHDDDIKLKPTDSFTVKLEPPNS